MNEFENKKVKTKYGEVHTSRIISSWTNMGGNPRTDGRFDKYMERLGIDEEDRSFIRNFATNGKLEFQLLARTMLMS